MEEDDFELLDNGKAKSKSGIIFSRKKKKESKGKCVKSAKWTYTTVEGPQT